MLEERLEIGEMTLPVQMHDVRACYRDAALFEDMQLHGDIGEMLLFLGVCRLHLREMKALPVRPEDVDGNERVVGEKAGLEDRRRAVVDQFAGEFDALVDGLVWEVHENPAGVGASCQCADVCSLIKPILKHLVRLELERERLVDFPPEELVAL